MFEIQYHDVQFERPGDVYQGMHRISRQVLRSSEFRPSGRHSGAFAVVRTSKVHPHSAIKCSFNDPAYIAYVEALSKLDEPNPFAPQIKSAFVINGTGGITSHTMVIVVMERLESLGHCIGKMSELVYAIDLFVGARNKERRALYAQQIAQHFNGVVPTKLEELLMIIRKAMGKHSNDIHDGNVMLRGKQLVITDPLS